MQQCPFCEHTAPTMTLLCHHLAEAHHGQLVGERRLLRKGQGVSVLCWCGRWFKHGVQAAPSFREWAGQDEEEWSKWAQHLIKQGGAQAHALAHILGVPRSKKKRRWWESKQ